MTPWPPFRMKEEIPPRLKLSYARKRIAFVQQILWMLSTSRSETRTMFPFNTLTEIQTEALYVFEELEWEIDWEALELIKQGEKELAADEDAKEADEEPPAGGRVH